MAKKRKKALPIYVVSGATGKTADQVVKAALAQFTDPDAQLIYKPGVRSAQVVARIVKDAADKDGVIIHSLVVPDIRDALKEAVEKHGVPMVDVLGPVLSVLNDHLKAKSRNLPGLFYKLEKAHFDRIDAVDFTLAHDDGLRIGELALADVVVVGVSRVAKSVTCFYLAASGVRAANVPLVVDQELPAELLELPAKTVVGLTMNPLRLQAIRETRMKNMPPGSIDFYVDAKQVRREVTQMNAVMKEHNWRCIDVSYMSVEEIAREVLAHLGR